MKDTLLQHESTCEFEALHDLPATQHGPTGATRPTHEQIAARAYDIYVNSGSKQGRCRQNWLEAERDLRRPAKSPSTIAGNTQPKV